MANFIGTFEGRLDDKGRLVLPAPFRSKELPDGGILIVHKNIFEKALDLYTQEEWQKFSDEVFAGVNKHTREGNKAWIRFNLYRNEIYVDAKNGRIMITKTLMDMVNIDKEVCFFGNGNKISLWAKSEWDKLNSEVNDDQFAEMYERLMNK